MNFPKRFVDQDRGQGQLFKRSVWGTHVHVSKKHMKKYLSEFDFRRNTRGAAEMMF